MVLASPKFQAPKGTRDVLPPDSNRRRALTDVFARRCELAGYGQIISPMFEELGVFKRLGESTDVVTKEMFDFQDKDPKNPTHLALRPEQTASIVRAFVQHRPVVPWKVWYEGPQFRYERPQAGRYREFNQLGVEVLGSDDPQLDIEVIALASRFYGDLGLQSVKLHLNSLGDSTCTPIYVQALTEYFRDNLAGLSEQSAFTLDVNPLRVLDSKREQDQTIIDAAPVMVDFLSSETADHFAAVRAGLELLGIDYQISARLVRGLDYYTRTIFEFAGEALAGSQNAVGGGGRYDKLAENLGGPNTPGIGFALGVERILLACDAEEVFPAPETLLDVFVVDVTGGQHGLILTEQLRNAGIRADRAFDGRSMKAQMKVADRSGAPIAMIVGEDEVAADTVTIRSLRTKSEQQVVPRSHLVDETKKLLETLT